MDTLGSQIVHRIVRLAMQVILQANHAVEQECHPRERERERDRKGTEEQPTRIAPVRGTHRKKERMRAKEREIN